MSIRHSVFLAIVAILSANLILTFNDALVKLAQGTFSLWAVFWLRAMVAVPVLVLCRVQSGFRPKAPGLVALRSVLLACSWVALYTAFNYMPISTAVAIVYSNPIIVAVLTAVLDRRALSAPLWGAVIFGFAGAVLVVQPQIGGPLWAYVFPIICAATYAVAMVITSRRLGGEQPITLSLGLNLAFMGIGAIGILAMGDGLIATLWVGFAERPGSFLAMGGIVAMAAIFVAYAFQHAPAPMVSVFDYSYLLFAILWGFVFFGEMPNGLAVLGMLCICGAGGLTMWDRSPKQT
ncbi:MAG: DMT family transporter, partial [Pseudomonadota bacterium]